MLLRCYTVRYPSRAKSEVSQMMSISGMDINFIKPKEKVCKPPPKNQI